MTHPTQADQELIAAAKHTPGPWVAATKEPRDQRFEVCTVENFAVYAPLYPNDYRRSGEPLTDARLIAAAPELLAALQDLYDRALRELADPDDVPELDAAREVLAALATPN